MGCIHINFRHAHLLQDLDFKGCAVVDAGVAINLGEVEYFEGCDT